MTTPTRDTATHPPQHDDERLARGLGWFSIGLGLAEIAAPRSVARMIGVSDDDGNRNTLFAVGLRDITSGVGLLSNPRSAGWAWSRVGGDAMDLALLGSALGSDGTNRNRVAGAAVAVLGVAAVDLLASQRLSRMVGSPDVTAGPAAAGGVHVTHSITVNCTPEEAYRFWHDFQNLPRFMEHVESVVLTGGNRSHWKAKAPAGTSVEWDAEVVDDRPNELIAWRSLEGADVPNSGSVRFRPAPRGRGTEIQVEMHYDPPGGRLGVAIAKLFGEEAEPQMHGDLRRFKQMLEIGEVVRSDASIHRGMHPAQPAAEPPMLAPDMGGATR